MQWVLTLTLVTIAAAYVVYSFVRTWFSDQLRGHCGGGCKSCPQGNHQQRNEKGEPVTLVPLQDFNR